MRIHGLRVHEREVGSGLLVLRFVAAIDAAIRVRVFARLAEDGAARAWAPARDPDSGAEVVPAPAEVVADEWIAPVDGEGVERQRGAFEDVAARFGLVEVWCVRVDTEVDASRHDHDHDHDHEHDHEHDHDHGGWKFGAPPGVRALGCPLEGYPEILEDWDPEDFGIAIKLGGVACAGDEALVRSFHSFWLAPYWDGALLEAGAEFEPYRHAAVEFDPVHRAALLWVDRFFVPIAASEAVHHLMWVVARLADVIHVEHARFAVADMSIKYSALFGDTSTPFVLAGNPLRERFHCDGEVAALSWAEAQRTWSRRELAAMLAELVTEHDPTQPDTSAIALRLCERGIALDPDHQDLPGYRMQLLVEQGRVVDAVVHARPTPVLLAHLVGLVAERALQHLGVVLDALDAPTLSAIAGVHALVEQYDDNVHSLGRAELVQPLVLEVATHAPQRLAAILAALPRDAALVSQLHAAAHRLEGPIQMQVFDALLALPRPARTEAGPWTDWLRAVNNACIHAHAQGDIARACEIAELAQDVAADNPYIFHSAACAYAAAGDHARALQQVELAVRHRYEHLDKLRADTDLGPLRSTPEFIALFEDR